MIIRSRVVFPRSARPHDRGNLTATYLHVQTADNFFDHREAKMDIVQVDNDVLRRVQTLLADYSGTGVLTHPS